MQQEFFLYIMMQKTKQKFIIKIRNNKQKEVHIMIK